MLVAMSITGLPAILLFAVIVVLVILTVTGVIRPGSKGVGRFVNKKGGGGTGAGGV